MAIGLIESAASTSGVGGQQIGPGLAAVLRCRFAHPSHPPPRFTGQQPRRGGAVEGDGRPGCRGSGGGRLAVVSAELNWPKPSLLDSFRAPRATSQTCAGGWSVGGTAMIWTSRPAPAWLDSSAALVAGSSFPPYRPGWPGSVFPKVRYHGNTRAPPWTLGGTKHIILLGG